MTLIGKSAPQCAGEAVIDGSIKKISLDDFGGKYKVLFFYPLDFTFVCPTELHAFQESLPDFTQRNAVVLGVSVDSVHSHLAWLSMSKEQGGIQGITYPLLADITKNIARAYGVLDEEAGTAWRAVFIIDKKNSIQSIMINTNSLGRSTHEVLRILDAVIYTESHGEACPANWVSGKKALKTTHEGVVKYFCEK